MDFRDKHCAWCELRRSPLERCVACPRYRVHELQEEVAFTSDSFCGVCLHRDDPELTVFCETNRRMQSRGDEPFDCYRFLPRE